MRGNREKEYINFRNKIIIVLIVGVILALFVFVIFTKNSDSLKSKMKKVDTLVVFVNSDDCDKCSEVKSYLDSKNVSYEEMYESNSSLNDLLKEYDFNLDESIAPSVLYISKGKLYSSLVNINSTDELGLFIDNYKLSK